MKITNVKAMVAKVFTVGLLAAAVAIAAPSKAQAQVGIGVRIGPAAPVYGPVYRQPVYGPQAYRRPVVVGPGFGYGYAPGFYGRPYGWDHREAFFRHDDHRFYRR